MGLEVTPWKILFIASVLVTVASLLSLPSLYTNISGDSVPNRPQREPPMEYQWDQAVQRILLAVFSAAIGVYAWKKI